MKPARPVVISAGVVLAVSAASAQLPNVPVPPGNPITADKVNLGKTLFWDEQISSTRTVACGTCHMPDAGGGDPRAGFSVNPGPDGRFKTADDVHGSPGVPLSSADGTYRRHDVFALDVQVTGRMAPSAINAAFQAEQFWDGRAGSVFKDPLTGATVLKAHASLESQAANPPVGDAEMAHHGRDWRDVAKRVGDSVPLALATNVPAALEAWIGKLSYPDLFRKAFGDPNVTPARILMAIATYERTLISDKTPFDRGTLTPTQKQGLAIFGGKGRCFICHSGPLFRGANYHNTGVRPWSEDVGRFAVTKFPEHRGAFKTPGLRNLSLRTAFMHNGGFASLAQVIDFYDRGGDFKDNLDPAMKPLGLTVAEKAALHGFLWNGLADPRVAARQPPFDRPTLYAETARVPRHYGRGAPGSGGFEPRLIAIEPPVLGNPNLTMAFAGGLGGAMSFLAIDLVQGFGQRILDVPVLVGLSNGMVLLPIGSLHGTGAGRGYWSGTMTVPADRSLGGVSLYVQGFSFDSGASAGLSGTSGLQVTFFDSR